MKSMLNQPPFELATLVAGGFGILIALLLLLLFKMYKTLYTDPLTKRANYSALCRDAKRLIGKHPERYALVYMDICRFKVINDTYGYATGDGILIATSDTLLSIIGPGERMARIHADVFAMLLHYEGQAAFQSRLASISEQLGCLSTAASDKITPLYKGGVYPLSNDFENLDAAFDRAHYAKDSITHLLSNTFVFYDDVIHIRVLREKELEDSMYSALKRGEFVPYYQPKVNAVTEKVMGAEALVRWMHPEKGCLVPSEFIPFYEKNGFIVHIDLSIFEQVCRDINHWLQSGHPAVLISVNFSRRNVQNQDLPIKLKEIADRYQVPTKLLEIEITETEELEDLETAITFVELLRSFGFSISVDDYGTGYSSISFLQKLPMDTLKLDRKFIMNALTSDKAEDIMRYLVSTMHKNGIRIICEGVETQRQRDFVIGLDCRFIQGFLYSVPLDRKDFEDYMQEHGTETATWMSIAPLVDIHNNHLTGVEDFLSKAMPSWVFICTMQPGRPIVYISPNLLAELGYGRLEFHLVTNDFYINAVHPDDAAAASDCIHNRKNGEELTLQYRLRRKDGSFLWVKEINRNVITQDYQQALLSICTDIDDLVTLETEKNRLIEAIPGGVAELLLTEYGPVLQRASGPFYKIIGHTPAEMEAHGNNLFHILNEEAMPDAKDTLLKILQQEKTSCDSTFLIRYNDGSSHWVTFYGAMVPSTRLVTAIIHNSDDEMNDRQTAEIERSKLTLALKLTGQAVFEYDMDTETVYSHSGFSIFGVPDGVPLSTGKELWKSGFLHPEDAEKVEVMNQKIRYGEQPFSTEIRIHFQGEPNTYDWVRITLNAILNETGGLHRVIGIVENITLQKRFEYAFRQEAQFREAFTESSLMAYEVNLTRNTIQRISGSRGFRLSDLSNRLPHPNRFSDLNEAAIPVLVADEDRAKFKEMMSLENLMALYHEGVFEKELEYRRIAYDTQIMWNSALVRLLMDQLSGDIIAYVYHRDINERKTAERELMEQAERDPLTGVFNRITAERKIQDILSLKQTGESIHAFLMLDLNRFKAINDTYGHLIGDRYLIRLTHVLQTNVQEGDIVARMGGDEFMLFLVNRPDEESVRALVEKIESEVTAIGPELDMDLVTSVSIGIALVPKHGTSFEILYRHSDRAMYQVKHSFDSM